MHTVKASHVKSIRFIAHQRVRRRASGWWAWWFGFSASVSGAAETELADEFKEPIRWAETLGRALFAHDVATAHATDELAVRKILPKDRSIRGWVTEWVEAPRDAIVVSFVSARGRQLEIRYRVVVPAGNVLPEFRANKPAAALTEFESRQYRARQTAIEHLKERCSDSYNTVVLPQDRAGNRIWLVYLLAATTDVNAVLVGGHQRFEISADGTTVEAQRAFAKTCLVLSKQTPQGRPASLMMTHLLDPTPTEIHVYLNRVHGLPLYLSTVTNGRLWRVDANGIATLSSAAAAP